MPQKFLKTKARFLERRLKLITVKESSNPYNTHYTAENLDELLKTKMEEICNECRNPDTTR